jgi:ArsR family transcriptional regulator
MPSEGSSDAFPLDEALKALASGPRRQLLRIVSSRTASDCCAGAPSACACDDHVCACELAEALELAPSTISHHMRALVRAGLVSAEKRGLWVYYRAEREALAKVASEVAAL